MGEEGIRKEKEKGVEELEFLEERLGGVREKGSRERKGFV
jgi:hypothetical protein